MIEANEAALAKYEMEKGTLRFPASEELPLPLIRKLVKARAAELTRGGSADAKKRR
jgi:uncharacterized protein YdhG (YjbR/CyaY superfamily)